MFLKPGERHLCPKGPGCFVQEAAQGQWCVLAPPGPCWHHCTLQVWGRGPSSPFDFDSFFVESLCQAVDPRTRERLTNGKEAMKGHQADHGTGREAGGLSCFILG